MTGQLILNEILRLFWSNLTFLWNRINSLSFHHCRSQTELIYVLLQGSKQSKFSNQIRCLNNLSLITVNAIHIDIQKNASVLMASRSDAEPNSCREMRIGGSADWSLEGASTFSSNDLPFFRVPCCGPRMKGTNSILSWWNRRRRLGWWRPRWPGPKKTGKTCSRRWKFSSTESTNSQSCLTKPGSVLVVVTVVGSLTVQTAAFGCALDWFPTLPKSLGVWGIS